MVETSVAVATPSTTAARIRNGSTSAGSATMKGARDFAFAGARRLPGIRMPIAPTHDTAQQHTRARRRAAVRR